MKKNIKIISAVTAAITLFSAVAVFPASAAQLKSERTPEGYVSEYREFTEKYPGAVKAVADGMFNAEEKINIYDYKIPFDASDSSDITTLFSAAVNTNPELCFVGRGFMFSYMSYRGKYYYYELIPQYNDTSGNTLSKERIEKMKTEFYTRAQWYLDKVDDSMSDFEKAMILHDELALNSSYLLSGETYDLMVKGEGKCYGYSEAYSYLLAQAGVKSEIIESEYMNHQWNKVLIDGNYYHVDVTWDDPVNDKPGKVEHTYFLLSDSAIEGLSNPHYAYSTDYPSTDTRYDNMKFHDIDTKFCYIGNDSYAVDNGEKNLSIYSLESDSLSPAYSFSSEYWPAGSGYVWNGGFSGLQEKYGWLYFNTPYAVYTYDSRDGSVNQFGGSAYAKNLYGVRVLENKVYAVLADNPNVTGDLEFVDYCLTRLERGDTDGDGKVIIDDVTELQKVLANMRTFNEDELAAADFNRDGKADVADVTAIQRFIAEFDD